MTQSKTILISTLATSLLLLVGCTTQTATNTNVVNNTNSNTVANTNTSNDNTNVVVTNSNENANEVVNENTNTEQGNEVDTSDWLTYTNEEYGFSFRYPQEWVLSDNEGQSNSPNTYSVVGLSTGGNTPSLAVVIKKLPIEDIAQEIYEFDKELSPVVSDDTITINGSNVRRIIKSGIDFPVTSYLVQLENNNVLLFDSSQLYDKVVNTLIVN